MRDRSLWPYAALLIGLALAARGSGQESSETTPARHGVAADLKTYPQGSPKETLASVLKAVENKRIDYALAQLADPDWVDRRVQSLAGGFAALVEDSKGKLAGDPGAVKRLTKFLKDGEWVVTVTVASVRLKDVEDQAVFLRKSQGRWFIENRKK